MFKSGRDHYGKGTSYYGDVMFDDDDDDGDDDDDDDDDVWRFVEVCTNLKGHTQSGTR